MRGSNQAGRGPQLHQLMPVGKTVAATLNRALPHGARAGMAHRPHIRPCQPKRAGIHRESPLPIRSLLVREDENNFATVDIYWGPSAALVRNALACGVCDAAAVDLFQIV